MVEGRIEHRDVFIAALGIAIAVGVILTAVVLTGVYSVSAARPHYDPTTWLLDLVRKRSVWFHSLGVETPPLGDQGLIRLGAAHFESGCADCHGAPGRPANAVASAMLPAPPGLDGIRDDWQTREVFWIVQNGQKYTGMPAWTSRHRADEVWAVVAFLEQLPQLTEASYVDLAGTSGGAVLTTFFRDERPGFADLLTNCARCHGGTGAEPIHASVPVIAGQKAEYLARSLREYRAGRRESGFMQPVASTLSDAEIDELASHYSSQPEAAVAAPTAGDSANGGAIFAQGIPGQDVPACISCHSESGQPDIPRLTGQPAAYIKQQLLVFKNGGRSATPWGQIMTPVAQRLSDQQMRDVAAYLATAGEAP